MQILFQEDILSWQYYIRIVFPIFESGQWIFAEEIEHLFFISLFIIIIYLILLFV